MKQQLKLTLSMALFFLFVFVTFGTIVLNEKKEELFFPKIEEKLQTYFEENYKDLLNSTTTNIKYKNNEYIMTIKSDKNENLYFTIKYKNKKITDNYKENYKEGKTYLSYLEDQIEKEINKITNKKHTITILTTLDSMTSKIKEKVLAENNIKQLKIYNLKTEIPITNWDNITITNEITTTINTLEQNNITPKNYTIVITDKNNLYKSIEISNITTELIKNNTLYQVVDDIINNKESTILKEYNITYKILN